MPVSLQMCFNPIHLSKMLQIGVIDVDCFCHSYTPVTVLMPSTRTQCELASVRSKSAATSFASVSDCFASNNLTSSAKLFAYLSVSSMLENIDDACLNCARASLII